MLAEHKKTLYAFFFFLITFISLLTLHVAHKKCARYCKNTSKELPKQEVPMLTTLLNNWGDSSVTLGCLSISHFHFASGLARWIQYFIFFFKSMYGKRLILRVMERTLNKILSSLVHYHSSLLSFLDVHQPYWRAHFCKTYWCINWKITIYISWFTSQPISVNIPASVETVYLCKRRISGLDEELTSF